MNYRTSMLNIRVIKSDTPLLKTGRLITDLSLLNAHKEAYDSVTQLCIATNNQTHARFYKQLKKSYSKELFCIGFTVFKDAPASVCQTLSTVMKHVHTRV